MRLTKKKAIEICIELWEDMAETGAKYKSKWKGWDKYGEMVAYCPLCEYTIHREGGCGACPLREGGYEGCSDTYFRDWETAETKTERKRFARLFLEQLGTLK